MQPSKTCPCLTERLLMGRKESIFWNILFIRGSRPLFLYQFLLNVFFIVASSADSDDT